VRPARRDHSPNKSNGLACEPSLALDFLVRRKNTSHGGGKPPYCKRVRRET